MAEDGSSGAGLTRLLAVDFPFVVGREPRFVLTERAGLGFVRFAFIERAGLGFVRFAFIERAGLGFGVMARQIPVRGSCLKPSPWREVRCAGGLEEPFALSLPPNP